MFAAGNKNKQKHENILSTDFLRQLRKPHLRLDGLNQKHEPSASRSVDYALTGRESRRWCT